MANWILDNLYIIAFVVIGLVSWVKSLIEARQQAPPRDEQPFDPDPYFETEENWQPTHEGGNTQAVPPPLSMPQAPPPLSMPQAPVFHAPPQVPAQVQTLESHDSVLAKQHALQERLREVRQARGEKKAALARVPKGSTISAKPLVSTAPQTIRQQFKSRSSIRRAFVMREILDQPLSLR